VKTIIEPSREIPVVRECDVLVVGGGPAGLAASVAAARLGASVVLVERYGYLGGLATGGLVIWLPGFRPGGSDVYGGLALEWVQRVERAGGTAYRDLSETEQAVLADPELLKSAALDIVVGAQVDTVFHAWATASVAADGRVQGIVIESKSGRQAILASATVDATGDADVAAWSGAEYVIGRKGIALDFRVGGVDWDRYLSFCVEDRDQWSALNQDLHERTLVSLTYGDRGRCHNDFAWFNYRGVIGWDAIDVDDLSKAEVTLRRNVLRAVEYLRERVPGFERSFLVDTASQIGTRDSRRIVGGYVLTREDLNRGATFPDSIGRICNDPFVQQRFEIPYRALLPNGVEGLLVAGRPISTEPRVHEATRLIPPSLVTGQAAGTAAALAVRDGVSPRQVNLRQVQETLRREGVAISNLIANESK